MIIKIIIVTIIAAMLSVSALALDVSLQNENSSGDHILLKNAQFSTDTLPSSSISPSSISSIESSSNETEDYYIVQFKGFILEEWKRDVSRTGATLFSYVPNNAFIIRMNTSVKAEVETIDSVQWIGPYSPSYRISSALSPDSEQSGQEDILIMLFDSGSNEYVSNEVRSLGGEILDNGESILKVRINRSSINDIAAINGVSWVDRYVQSVVLNDVAAGIINVSTVQNTHGLTGSNQTVAVADTGLDTGFNNASMHDDFEGRINELYAWWTPTHTLSLNSYLYNDSGGNDQTGHGTHVTGSVLGNGNISGGLYSGMAPEARLVFQALWYDGQNRPSGLYTPTYLPPLFQEAYDTGAKIHSNSWGSGSAEYGNYTSQSQYVDSFMWNNPDMLIVFAAGNSGNATNTLLPPGTAKNALTVGASETYRPERGTLSDNIDDIAHNSSRGPTDDNRIKPDVVAPGTSIYSTASSLVSTTDYTYMSGTSMATPLTAGTAALVRQYYVDNESIYPTAALLKATLINGATDLGKSSDAQGWGRVDIEESLFPSTPRTMQYQDNISLGYKDHWSASYHLNNSSVPFKATLVWTDQPATISASKSLVNNLDLNISCPDGTYLGNGGDNTNNVEQVELSSPSTGWYTVTVNGTNVPDGPQPFAIVLSGPFSNDEIAPLSVTDLATSDRGTTWINWTWNNPIDPDLDHTMLYLDNVFRTNVSNTTNFYNVTGLTANTTYELSTKTVDLTGNINLSWTNDTANTIVAPDEIAPSSISNLSEYTTGPTWINWTWTKPLDSDFNHTMVYMDGKFKVNVTGTAYNATGLIDNTGHIISTHTVDNVGNINLTWINDSASTMNTLPPASVTKLTISNRGVTWINLTWNNPIDLDFNHTILYVDGVFETNVSNTTNFYNVTELTANTTYEFNTKTVDIAGNLNGSWVNAIETTLVAPDITAPTITLVTSTTANGSYTTGDVIDITIIFDENVNVTGKPKLTLETGINGREVEYTSGTGTDTLLFPYTVQSGDTSFDLDYTNTNALTLNGSTIKDSAGNDATLILTAPGEINSLGANKELVIDTTAPFITVDQPENNANYTTNEVPLNVTGDGTVANWWYKINGTEIGTFIPNTPLPALPDGDHNIIIYANDSLGNENSSMLINFSIDTIAPTVTIDVPKENHNYTSNIIWLNATADENIAKWWYNINNAGNSTFNGNRSLTLPDGNHNINVIAQDVAGNNGSAMVNFTIDTIAPTVTIDVPEENHNYTSNIIWLNATADENIAKWWYNINNAGNSTFNGNKSLTVPDGNHNITVIAQDLAGNNGSAMVNFTVDTIAPTITIDIPEENQNYTSNIIWLNATVDEDIAK
ncbi:S8 family serine peptidase [Methanococcoides sp. SA1]|nr:S8 family serine peptidase [Methanococcoides sp. SA1]